MDSFIARQPIFTADQQVFSYELLFRSGPENWFSPQNDGDEASYQLISDSTTLFDIRALTGGRRAFVNFTRKLILDGTARLLPPEIAVIEVLEDIEPDEEVVDALRALKQEGYGIAIDDVDGRRELGELAEIADYIKVDLPEAGDRGCLDIVQRYRRPGLKFLAEKVENWADYERMRELGFTLFQGYYFERPEIIRQKVADGNRDIYLALFREIGKPEMNLAAIGDLVKSDVSLSYRLLRLVNSPWYGIRQQVNSIEHALVLLGETNLRRLFQLTALASLGEDGLEELALRSAIRGGFLESVAGILGHPEREKALFLVGLFSRLDVLMGMRMDEALDKLGFESDIELALLDREGPLAPGLDLCEHLEGGRWSELESRCESLDIDAEAVSRHYLLASEKALSMDAELRVTHS